MAEKLSERLEAAREALDSMDDFARMEASIDPIGPRKVLEDFIEAAAELARRVEGAPREKVTHWEQACFAKAGVPIPDEGSYVRLVPEQGECEP